MRAAEDGEISDHYGANPPTTNQGIDMKKLVSILSFLFITSCSDSDIQDTVRDRANTLQCAWSHQLDLCLCGNMQGLNSSVLIVVPDDRCKDR